MPRALECGSAPPRRESPAIVLSSIYPWLTFPRAGESEIWGTAVSQSGTCFIPTMPESPCWVSSGWKLPRAL